jgi:hypothetical protein
MDKSLIAIEIVDTNYKTRGVSYRIPPVKIGDTSPPEPIPYEYITSELHIPTIRITGLPKQTVELLKELIELKKNG